MSIIYSMMKNQAEYRMPVLIAETTDEKEQKISLEMD